MRSLIFVLILIPLALHAEEEKAPKLGLKHESSLGYVVTGGNSTSETFNVKQETSYRWTKDLVKWTGNYLQTKAKSNTTGVTEKTAQNWASVLRYEKVLSARFNAYTQAGISGDKFQGTQERKAGGLGGKYYTIKTKRFEWFKELGYEYARELFIYDPTNANPFQQLHTEFHFARVYTQADYAYEKNLKFGVYVEYLYPFADQRIDENGRKPEPDYRVNFSPYMTSVLTDMFSLKISYEGRYRNTPVLVGNENLDFTFNTALLAEY